MRSGLFKMLPSNYSVTNHIYIYIYVYIYTPTPPLGQDMTQGQFLSEV